jgi:hypothetical protein
MVTPHLLLLMHRPLKAIRERLIRVLRLIRLMRQ